MVVGGVAIAAAVVGVIGEPDLSAHQQVEPLAVVAEATVDVPPRVESTAITTTARTVSEAPTSNIHFSA